MPIILRIIISFLTLFAICTPWYTNGNLNPDLLVLIQHVKTMPEDLTLLESFYDNTFLVFCFAKIFYFLDPKILIFLLHNFCIIFFSYVLNKFYNPQNVLIFILFSFFTIFLNQFRFALGISFFLISFSYIKKSVYYISLFFFIIGFLCHFFAGMWFSIIFLLYVLFDKNIKTKMLIYSILFICFIYFLFKIEISPRYLGYLQELDSVSSKTYIFTFMYLILFIKKVPEYLRYFLIITTMLVFLTSSLPSFSGRLGETSILTMLFFQNNESNRTSKFNYELIFGLLFAVIFFSYRFNNWILLGTVEIPSEIMI